MIDLLTGFDLVVIIKSVGYIGLFAIIFAESGLFIGFFSAGRFFAVYGGVFGIPRFFEYLDSLIANFFSRGFGR